MVADGISFLFQLLRLCPRVNVDECSLALIMMMAKVFAGDRHFRHILVESLNVAATGVVDFCSSDAGELDFTLNLYLHYPNFQAWSARGEYVSFSFTDRTFYLRCSRFVAVSVNWGAIVTWQSALS